jgi:hypothetical protein
MNTFPPIVIVIGFLAAFLGFFFGLYALLTRGQRRTMREIRKAARERGWRYRLRHWQGNPTSRHPTSVPFRAHVRQPFYCPYNCFR